MEGHVIRFSSAAPLPETYTLAWIFRMRVRFHSDRSLFESGDQLEDLKTTSWRFNKA